MIYNMYVGCAVMFFILFVYFWHLYFERRMYYINYNYNKPLTLYILCFLFRQTSYRKYTQKATLLLHTYYRKYSILKVINTCVLFNKPPLSEVTLSRALPANQLTYSYHIIRAYTL